MIDTSQIAIALGQPGPEGVVAKQWEMWIGDARMLIQNRLTKLGLGSIDNLNQADVDFVTREAVVAMARRPDGAAQVDVAVDDGRVSKRYTSSAGQVEITEKWWTILLPEVKPAPEAFTIRPYGVPDRPRW